MVCREYGTGPPAVCLENRMVTGSFWSAHRVRFAFPVASLTFSRSASQTIRKQLLPGIPKEIGSGGTDLQLAFLSHVEFKTAARDQIHVIYTLKIACQRSGDAYIGSFDFMGV